MAIDWELMAGAPCVEVFGEPATFTPASGATAYGIIGVFDDQFRATEIIDISAPTSDKLPVLGVNAAQFQAPPVQGDRIKFPAGTFWYAGKAFLVVEPRPDGHGMYHLALNETTP